MLGSKTFRRKPRQFEYKPRYYDPEKEAREQRRRELFGAPEPEPGTEDDKDYVPGAYIRKELMIRRGMAGADKPKKKGSLPMLIVAFIILLGILFWILT